MIAGYINKSIATASTLIDLNQISSNNNGNTRINMNAKGFSIRSDKTNDPNMFITVHPVFKCMVVSLDYKENRVKGDTFETSTVEKNDSFAKKIN